MKGLTRSAGRSSQRFPASLANIFLSEKSSSPENTFPRCWLSAFGLEGVFPGLECSASALEVLWSVHQDEVGLAVSYELCHRVMFTFGLNGACDAVVFQDGKEKLHKVRGVGRSYDIQDLGYKIANE